MNWIQRLFGHVEKDLEVKLQAALEEGKRQACSELTAVLVSRLSTMRPETADAGKVYLSAIGEWGK